MIELILLLCIILLISLILLFTKYAKLKGEIEERARRMFEEWRQEELKAFEEWRENEKKRFEEWRERELKSEAEKMAKILFEDWKTRYEESIRRDAIERSKSVIVGKVSEHLAPFLPNFKYNPKDVRFIGSPVDLIVFDGLDEGELRKIVFVEVKSGKSSLSKRERMIRDCIRKGKIEWEELRI